MSPPLSAQPVDGLPSVEALSPGLLKNVMSPLWWDAEAHVLEMVDQTVLPETYRTVVIDSAQATFDAIKTMVVRGAPAIGLAGAYGLAALWGGVLLANLLTFMLAMPGYIWRAPYRQALLRLPRAFFYALQSMLTLKHARRYFINTPHGENK